jgi:hypothetical protein
MGARAFLLGLSARVGIAAGVIVLAALAYAGWSGRTGAREIEEALVATSTLAAGVGALSVLGSYGMRGFRVQYAETTGVMGMDQRSALAASDLASSYRFSLCVVLAALLVGGPAAWLRYGFT